MKALFFRLIEAEDKAAALRASIDSIALNGVFQLFQKKPEDFRKIPKSPFAYWASDALLSTFSDFEAFGTGDKRYAKQGLATADDFRFVRLSWEIPKDTHKTCWHPFAKGGGYSPYYSDIHLFLNWGSVGREIKAWAGTLYGNSHWSRIIKNVHLYFRPGLTWPLRTNGLSFRIMPEGCAFGHKGPAAFCTTDGPREILALAATVNSKAFGALVSLQLARTELAQSYEVGLIQQTPVPNLSSSDQQVLASLAKRGWSLMRVLDSASSTSHAFEAPSLMQGTGSTLIDRLSSYTEYVGKVERELASLEADNDRHCFILYGISDEDRARIDRGFVNSEEHASKSGKLDEAGAQTKAGNRLLVSSLLSWSVGVAFGRFDLRFATGDREMANEPEPFAPLPTCSPGMLSGDDGLPLLSPPPGYPVPFPEDGTLVDDQGHSADLVSRSRAVFEQVFDEPEARWHEAAELVGARNQDLCVWFAKDFFAYHIKQYSKSRRKAPIYWQLATPSASYSVWCYYHRLTRDTFFRVANDYVNPKVDHEERKLNTLRQEAGPDPSSKQRKEIDAQETFVAELRAFLTEVKRIAPLWNPNLNDGVIINFAPLWRLVPQHKAWQKECKKAWDKLVKGDYDWAHLAMHLWPERVVPKCQDDRSLAIAHGLEDDFWYEDDEGKKTVWKKRQVSQDRVAELVAERSSTAVKAALEDLLSAPTPSGSKRRTRRGGRK